VETFDYTEYRTHLRELVYKTQKHPA